jgi:hypothetical protein
MARRRPPAQAAPRTGLVRARPPGGRRAAQRLAEDELRQILDDEDQGVGIAAPAREITIAEAAREWLRYVEFDRACKPSTLPEEGLEPPTRGFMMASKTALSVTE